jgi:hypothetical protein
MFVLTGGNVKKFLENLLKSESIVARVFKMKMKFLLGLLCQLVVSTQEFVDGFMSELS